MDDMKRLKLAILNQSIQDYIKLQHPKYRSKRYLEESFLYSVSMFFDPSYSFLYFFNENGEHQTSLEFVASATNAYIKNLDPMRDYLKKESIKYWKNKYMKTFTIPPYLVYNGTVYNILMSKTIDKIDFEKNEIFFDKKDSKAELIFIQKFIKIMKKEHSLRISKKDTETLAIEFLAFLKMNKLYND